MVFVAGAGDPGRSLPGGPAERRPTRDVRRFNQRFGLNEPIPVQFALYLRDLATGNLGESLRPVSRSPRYSSSACRRPSN